MDRTESKLDHRSRLPVVSEGSDLAVPDQGREQAVRGADPLAGHHLQPPDASRSPYVVRLHFLDPTYWRDLLAGYIAGKTQIVDPATGEVKSGESWQWLLNDENDEEYNRHLSEVHKVPGQEAAAASSSCTAQDRRRPARLSRPGGVSDRLGPRPGELLGPPVPAPARTDAKAAAQRRRRRKRRGFEGEIAAEAPATNPPAPPPAAEESQTSDPAADTAPPEPQPEPAVPAAAFPEPASMIAGEPDLNQVLDVGLGIQPSGFLHTEPAPSLSGEEAAVQNRLFLALVKLKVANLHDQGDVYPYILRQIGAMYAARGACNARSLGETLAKDSVADLEDVPLLLADALQVLSTASASSH
jgi:hypothetical protein